MVGQAAHSNDIGSVACVVHFASIKERARAIETTAINVFDASRVAWLASRRRGTYTAGQILGLLGNTGNSSAPHLHFGLVDDPDPLVAESLPMVFDEWTLEGTVPLEAWTDQTGQSSFAPTGTPEEQTGTLQLFLDIASFD